jgi:hypothetical protein
MPRPGEGPRFYSGRHPMKKQVKKLVLAKETVRSLHNVVLGQVVGDSEYPFYCNTDTFYVSCNRYCDIADTSNC